MHVYSPHKISKSSDIKKKGSQILIYPQNKKGMSQSKKLRIVYSRKLIRCRKNKYAVITLLSNN